MIKKQKNISKKNAQLKKYLDKYFKLRYLLLLAIGILALALFSDFMIVVILMVAFLPVIAWSQILSKIIPHINVDLLSGVSALLGYLYGPWITLVYTIFAGFYALYKSSFIRYLQVVRVIFVGLTNFVMAYFTDMSFNQYFIIGILIQNVILYFVYSVLDPDPIQNYTHRGTHLLSNLLIIRYIFVPLVTFLNMF
jgi:hypothetical protein